MKRVLLGMSGGVDSSVSALLLKEMGYEVIGITLELFAGSCCNIDTNTDAKNVCKTIGIPHITYNLKEQFKCRVIDNFIDEYSKQRTPNPCIECNRYMKFGLMYEKAKELNCDYIATGHYAKMEYSEKYVGPLGYQGNNLLCSNWSIENMQDLDYNGIFEYLYNMKYGKKFSNETGVAGVTADEFESVIMTYLPVTAEELKEWAVYDEQSNTYAWQRLGYGNYAPTHFGLSLPEVIEIKHNEDGTVVLTINAVCDSVVCNDAVITHELTVKFQNDGSVHYVGNRILDNGIDNIPKYQYRLDKLQD